MSKRNMTPGQYRVLAIVWTLAAAAVLMAVVRRLPEFQISSLLLLAGSLAAAVFFWKGYKRTQPKDSGVDPADPFDEPPRFADNPVLFDDDPYQDSEEKNHER